MKKKLLSIITLSLLLGGCDPLMMQALNPLPPLHFKTLLARAEMGDTDAQLKAASMLSCPAARCAFGPWRPKCDDAACSKWLHRAAEGGNPEAQTRLADRYISGGCQIEKNAPEAIKWYLKAAEQGNPRAYLSLASLYGEGVEVARDDALAARWYEKAAESGFSQAQLKLANMYVEGRGVPKDSTKAREWARKAASKNKLYKFELGVIYAETDPPDYIEAYYWTTLVRPALSRTSLSPDFYNRWPAEELEKHLTAAEIADVRKRVEKETSRICEDRAEPDHRFFCPTLKLKG